jgi:hypothetical protein
MKKNAVVCFASLLFAVIYACAGSPPRAPADVGTEQLVDATAQAADARASDGATEAPAATASSAPLQLRSVADAQAADAGPRLHLLGASIYPFPPPGPFNSSLTSGGPAAAMSWVTPNGDVSLSGATPGLTTVTGLKGTALPALSVGYLNWTGTAWALSAPSAISSYGADLSTTGTLTAQYVDALSFSATGAAHGVGGVISVNGTGTLLNWVDDVARIQKGGTTVEQLGLAPTDFTAYGATPGSAGFIRVPSAASTTWLAANGHGILYTDSSNDTILDSATTAVSISANGTAQATFLPGTAAIAAANWTYTGSSAWTIGWNSSATAAGASGTYQCGQNAGGATNVGGSCLFETGAGTGGAAPGALTLGLGGGTNALVLSGSSLGTMSWQGSVAPVWTQVSTSGPTGTNWIWRPEQSTATPGTGGNAIVDLQVPNGAGNEAMFEVTRGNVFAGAIGPHPGSGATFTDVWLTPGVVPSASNYTLLGSSTITTLNVGAGGTVSLNVNNGGVVIGTASSVAFFTNYEWDTPSGTVTTQTNRVTEKLYDVQTTSATATTFANIPIASNRSVTITVTINGKSDGTPVSAAYSVVWVGTFWTNGSGAVTSVGTTQVSQIPGSGPSVTANIATANTVFLLIGGEGGTTDWEADVKTVPN